MAGPIRIAVLANASQAKRELNDVTTRGQRFQKAMQTAGRIAAAGLLVVGAAAVKAGQAAAEDEQAQSKLTQTLRTAAKATDAQVKATDRFIESAGKQYGVTDDELRPALSKLAVATKDVGKAQQLATLAMDISAATGKDLNAVSMALAKAQYGQTAALGKLGVKVNEVSANTGALKTAQLAAFKAQNAYNQAVSENGKNSDQAREALMKLELAQGKVEDATGKVKKQALDADDVLKDLAKTYGGAASKNAQTAAGKQKILAVQLGELQEQIGAKLLPVMNQAATAGLAAIQWLSDNGTAAKALAIAVASITVAVLAVNAAQKAYAAGAVVVTAATKGWAAATKTARAAQIAFNIAMALSPIGVLVAGVALLVAGLVLAYKKSDRFRAIVNGAFRAVVDGAKAAVGWIKDKWPILLAIITGPFGLAVLAITKNWDKIKAGATAVKDWIGQKFDAILTKIKTIASNIRDALLAPFEKLRDLIEDIIEKLKKVKAPDLNPFNGRRVAGAGSSSYSSSGAVEVAQTYVDQSTTYIDTAQRTYQISVAVAPGGSLVEAGRQIRQALDAYETANGRKLVTS